MIAKNVFYRSEVSEVPDVFDLTCLRASEPAEVMADSALNRMCGSPY